MFLWRKIAQVGCALNHLWILSRHQTFLDTIWTGWPVQLKRGRERARGREKERESDLAVELQVGEAKRESTKQDKCRLKLAAGEGDVDTSWKAASGRGKIKPTWLFTRAKLSEEQRWRQRD